jgi:hypothetical protein
MTISRRSFARSIVAAVAGATVLRQAVASVPATPLTPAATAGGRAFTAEEIFKLYDVPASLVLEGPRTIMEKERAFDHEAFNEWKSYSLQPRRLCVRLQVSREVLKDGPSSAVSVWIQHSIALLARRADEEWGRGAEYTVATICDDEPLSPFITYTRIATEDKDYRMQRLRDEWRRIHVQRLRDEWRRIHVGPRNVTTLPDGWEKRQYGSYKATDGLPADDPKDWLLLARGPLDAHSPPR